VDLTARFFQVFGDGCFSGSSAANKEAATVLEVVGSSESWRVHVHIFPLEGLVVLSECLANLHTLQRILR